MLEVVISEPSTDGGWTTVERKANRTNSTSGISNVMKPFTNGKAMKTVKFSNTGTHMEMRMRDNGMSDRDKNQRCDAIAGLMTG